MADRTRKPGETRGRKRKDYHPSDPNFRPGRHGDGNTAAAYKGVPSVPESVTLDPIAQEMWHLVVAEVPAHLLAAVDGPGIASLCQWWSIYQRLEARYAECPEDAALGRQVKQAHDTYQGWADRFGLSVKPRQKFKVADNTEAEADPMAKKLGLIS